MVVMSFPDPHPVAAMGMDEEDSHAMVSEYAFPL